MTKKALPKLSPAETEVLRLVWQSRSATVQEVCDQLPDSREIAYATVQTLLRRLEKKGYLQHEVVGRAHRFFPSVEQDVVVRRSVRDFMNRLFGGDPVPLLHHLARHGDLRGEDLDRLRQLLDEIGEPSDP